MSKIEEVLNLPKLSDALKEINADDEEILVIKADTDEYIASMQTAIDYAASQDDADAKALIEHDKDMDKIATVAFQHHETFIELSINVDPKQAEAFVNGAVQMLSLSFNASKEKGDKRLKWSRHKLDKERLEVQKGNQPGVIEGEGGILADRNDVLDRLLEQKNK